MHHLFYLLRSDIFIYIMQSLYVCSQEGVFGEETSGGETEAGRRGGGLGEESGENEYNGKTGKHVIFSIGWMERWRT